ncbi:MAG: cysteine desulfurase family protein [bacterium]
MPVLMNRIYLDYCATTPLAPEVFSAMHPYLMESFGNASSIHGFGRDAKVALEAGRETVAKSLGALPQEIVFTSGGTEANNFALFGAANTFAEPRHIITSRIEHPCVLSSCKALEQRGWKLTYIEPEATGMITAEAVARALRPETALISIMHANNEVGTINPIREIAVLAAERHILFHTDAVQSLGKIPMDVRELPVSLLTLSGHKIYGPKGVGALFIRRGVRIQSLLYGGKQERDRRPGTENVAAIVGLARALELRHQERDHEAARLFELSQNFALRVRELYPAATLNSHPQQRVPGIVNLSFPGFDSLSMVMSLDLQGIAVSNGSACSAGSVEPSHVLRAMKLGAARENSAIRFSLGRNTTAAEIDTALAALEKILARKTRGRKLQNLEPAADV